MRRTLFAGLLGAALMLAGAAQAAGPSCEEQATAKKLAGAARTSFVKKCEKDAKG